MNELELIESARDLEGFEVELRSADAVQCFYRSLCDWRSATALQFVECGNAFRSFALFDEALKCYGEAIARDGVCLEAYVKRGELLFELAVCGGSDEEILRFGRRSADDFRKALVLSMGANEVAVMISAGLLKREAANFGGSPAAGFHSRKALRLVWGLGIVLLLVDDTAGAQGLAENVLMKGKSLMESVRCDFLYLLGLAKVFMSDNLGADEVFEELLGLEGGVECGWFGKLVSCLALSDGAQAEVILAQLKLRDAVMWEAGLRLQRSGCSRFVCVAKTLLDVGNAVVRKKARPLKT